MITGRRTAGCSYRLMPMLETLAIDEVIEVSRLGLPKALANYPTAFSHADNQLAGRHRLAASVVESRWEGGAGR